MVHAVGQIIIYLQKQIQDIQAHIYSVLREQEQTRVFQRYDSKKVEFANDYMDEQIRPYVRPIVHQGFIYFHLRLDDCLFIIQLLLHPLDIRVRVHPYKYNNISTVMMAYGCHDKKFCNTMQCVVTTQQIDNVYSMVCKYQTAV